MNLHHDGVDPSQYSKNQKIAAMFDLLSTNVDRKGKPFGSTLEGKKYPIYAVQWHPERNQHVGAFPFTSLVSFTYLRVRFPRFEWDLGENLDKTHSSMVVVQYLANFFVQEARKNNHRFPSTAEEKAALIYQHAMTFTGDDSGEHFPDQQTYYFNLKTAAPPI